MRKRQQEVIAAYRRAHGFLMTHPIPSDGNDGGDDDCGNGYGEAQRVLAEVVARLDALSTGQCEGARLGRNETARQRVLKRELRSRYLVPIARVARAALSGTEGIDVALRAPSRKHSARRLLADARAVWNAVAEYQGVFRRHGFARTFFPGFQEVLVALEASLDARALHLTGKVGATHGLAQELRRGRAALEILDTVVGQHFAGDAELLGEWGAAKRVHRVGGRARLVAEGEGEALRVAA